MVPLSQSASEAEDWTKAPRDVLSQQRNISGFVYAQLIGMGREANGIYTHDRKPKFNLERLKKTYGRWG